MKSLKEDRYPAGQLGGIQGGEIIPNGQYSRLESDKKLVRLLVRAFSHVYSSGQGCKAAELRPAAPVNELHSVLLVLREVDTKFFLVWLQCVASTARQMEGAG